MPRLGNKGPDCEPAPHEWQLRGPLLCLVRREQIVILQAWIGAWAQGATLAGTQGLALSWALSCCFWREEGAAVLQEFSGLRSKNCL